MSAPGCCRHCAAECETTDEQHVLEFDGSWILLRTCPACDEAERIAAKCIEWAEGCYQRGEDDAVRELNEMADFARGDR